MNDFNIKLKTTADEATWNASLKKLQAQSQEMVIKARIEASTGVTGLSGKSAKESASVISDFMKASKQVDTFNVKLKNLKATGGLTTEQFDKFSSKLSTIDSDFKSGSITLGEFSDKMGDLGNEVSTASTETKAMGQSVTEIVGKFTKWYLISGLVTGAISLLKQAVQFIIDLDASLVEFNKVADVTETELKNITDQAYKMADALGTTGKDVIDAATEFKRMGYSVEESMDLAKVATTMTNVAEGIDDAGEAASILTSILKGTGLGAEYSASLLDRLNEVSNNNAVSFDALANMMQESSATMNILGNNIDETMGMLTGAYAVLQDESVAKGISTIGLRIAGLNEDMEEEAGLANEVSKALKDYAGINVFDEQTGQLKDTYEIMQELAGVWDTLDKNEQSVVLNKLAGKQRAGVAAALLNNWEEVEKAVDDAANSMGSAEKEQEKYLESIEGKINSVKNAFQTFARSLIESDWIKQVVDLIKELFEALTPISKLINVLLKMGGISSALKGVTDLLTVIGWLADKISSFLQIFTNNKFSKIMDFINKYLGFGWAADLINKAENTESETSTKNKNLAETFDKLSSSVDGAKDSTNAYKTELQDLIDVIQGRLDQIDSENEQLDKQEELQEKLLSVEKARAELAEARNKKVRVFRAGKGFVYESDASGVQSAQETLSKAIDDLADFNYESQLEKAQNFVEKLQEMLTDGVIDGWEEFFEEYSFLLNTEFAQYFADAKAFMEQYGSNLKSSTSSTYTPGQYAGEVSSGTSLSRTSSVIGSSNNSIASLGGSSIISTPASGSGETITVGTIVINEPNNFDGFVRQFCSELNIPQPANLT